MTKKISQSTIPEYLMGYSEEFLKLLERRNAEKNAAHLLPHLKVGMRVLDFGCGPGTISLGLANAIAPGELHGIDIEESQIAIARSAAVAGKHTNVTFHVGDVLDLPFEDNEFDAAHCHALLVHASDTKALLMEVMRVLKPGGIISCRELICASSFYEPDLGFAGDMWKLFANRLSVRGGHPQMGRELRRVLSEVGFSEVEQSASFECFASDSDLSFLQAFGNSSFYDPDIMKADIERGVATQEQFDEWQRLWNDWPNQIGAFGAFAWGEAIGRKPGS